MRRPSRSPPAARHEGDHRDARGRSAGEVEATRGYGAEIVSYDRWTRDREEIGRRLAEERGSSSCAVRRSARDGGPGDDGARAAHGHSRPRPPRRARRRRRAHRRVRDGGESARPGIRVVGVEPRQATTRDGRSQRGSASTSTCRARPRTGYRPRARRAHVRGEPRCCSTRSSRSPTTRSRGDDVPLRPSEARHRAERRRRHRGPPHGPRPRTRRRVGVVISGGNAAWRALRRCRPADSPAPSTSTMWCSAVATASSSPGKTSEDPPGDDLVDGAVVDDRGRIGVEVAAENALHLAALEDPTDHADRPHEFAHALLTSRCARSRG